jgi:hypothetical protein
LPAGLRLVGGPSNEEGRLEVNHDGEWGTVCDDDFEEIDAKVACWSLGFGFVTNISGVIYGLGSISCTCFVSTIWL